MIQFLQYCFACGEVPAGPAAPDAHAAAAVKRIFNFEIIYKFKFSVELLAHLDQNCIQSSRPDEHQPPIGTILCCGVQVRSRDETGSGSEPPERLRQPPNQLKKEFVNFDQIEISCSLIMNMKYGHITWFIQLDSI